MSEKNTSHGITFLGMLQILFIGLKLTRYITWSWWWVLAPLWIPLAIALGAIVLVGIVCLILFLVESNNPKIGGSE